MKKYIAIALVVSFTLVSQVHGAGTQAGDTALGIYGSLSRMTTSGSDGDNSGSNYIIGALDVNHFLTDAISLGAIVTGTIVAPDEEDSAGMVFGEAQMRYHFLTESSTVPYIGAHGGGMMVKGGGTSQSVGTVGAQGGVKFFISERTTFDTQLKYNYYQLDDDLAANNLSFNLGISFLF